MTPLLLYLLPMFGAGEMGMKAVAGLTMVQGLSGSLSGMLVHRRFRFVSRDLVLYMGLSIAMASLGGALLSKHVSDELLKGIFAAMALVASVMMFVPKEEDREDRMGEEVPFSRPRAVAIAMVAGFLGGMVGQGGAFLLIPMMLYVLKIPTRITIGSTLGIAFCSALAGFLGKLATAQIPLNLALVLVAGVVPGAQLGGYISKHTPTRTLRAILALFIALTALKMGSEVWLPHVHTHTQHGEGRRGDHL